MEPASCYDDMPLTEVVKEWMDSEDWKDEIEIKNGRKAARVVTNFSIHSQPHRVYLEVNEPLQFFEVYVYSVFHVPPARMPQITRVINRINYGLRTGRLACCDDEDANSVQFKCIIDVEGSRLGPSQVGRMLSAGIWTFEKYGPFLATIALTRVDENEAWVDFLEEEKKQEEANAEGPAEL